MGEIGVLDYTKFSDLMRYILSPLLACGEGVGGGVFVPHNIGKCCIN